MPTYPVKNLKTGEQKEIQMSMTEYDQWREDNPDWDKDWMQGVANVGEVGEVYDKLRKTHTPVGMMYYTKHLKLPVLK